MLAFHLIKHPLLPFASRLPRQMRCSKQQEQCSDQDRLNDNVPENT
jgi:hypothetical protein